MQHRKRGFAPAAAMAALILAACGDGREDEIAEANLAAPLDGIDLPDGVIIYPAGTAASLETNTMRAEVERLQREQGGSATDGANGESGGQESRGTMGEDTGQQRGGAGGSGGGAAGFAGLDRDNDGRLSPAEFAIYNLPAETPARQGATHDEHPPFVSDEALNRSATSFRQVDTNGDFFLSPEEFSPDRR